jgi:hypothetical protein
LTCKARAIAVISASVAMLAVLALPSSALAALQFPPLGEIAGTPGVPFGLLQSESVAVNDSNGHILVADSSVGLVYDFTSASDTSPTTWDGSTTPAGSFGGGKVAVAVDNSTGDVYVADATDAVIDKFDSSGTLITAFGDTTPSPDGQLAGLATPAGSFSPPVGGFNGTFGIIVDQATHDLYAIDAGNQVVDVFDSTGAYQSQINDPAATSAGLYGCGGQYADGIAVNATTGHLFVSDSCPVQSFEFDGLGSYLALWNGANSPLDPGSLTPAGSFGGGYTSIATNDSSGAVYVTDTADQVTDYFDSAGNYLAQIPGAPGGSLGGIAVDQSSGNLYVSDNATGSVRIFAGTPVIVPDVTTNPAAAIGATTATLNGHVDPAGGPDVTDCHFDWGTDTSYGQTAACLDSTDTVVGTPGNPITAPTDVHADLTGLMAGTTYHFRLLAANANGSNQGEDATFATPPPPSIDAAAAQNLTPTEADLTAEINPNGADTTYRFDYGTDTSYGQTVPVPDADIGSGTTDVAVTQHITGLSPNTTYHWRILATNANGTSGADADHTFIYPTTGGGLPDNRAYEQVTPPDKNGALIGRLAFGGPRPALSEDGSRLILTTDQCFADAGSCPGLRGADGTPYAFARAGGGWVPTALAPPATQFDINTSWLVGADARTALFSAPTPPGGEDDFYARQPDGSLTHVGPITPPSAGPLGPIGWQQPSAATADYSHLLYSVIPSDKTLWPFDQTQTSGLSLHATSLYQYAGTAAQPALVGVSGGPGSTDLIGTCGTDLGSPDGRPPGSLSADGSTVYFTVLPCASGSGANAATPVPAQTLYARIDGELPGAHTVPISQPSPADCTTPACLSSPPGDANLQGASDNGSKAFFTSTQQLTDSASEDSHSGDTAAGTGCALIVAANGCNLYLHDFQNPAGHQLIDVSAGDSSGDGPRVQGVAAISPDGSHAYFVAKGVLSGAANAQGRTAQDGADNLYVFERDAAHPDGQTTFVSALSASDENEWQNGVGTPANVTPDGRFLVFTSRGALTPDTGASGVQQVFRYDAQTGDLVRISIGNDGFNDNGDAGAGDATIAPASLFSHQAGPLRGDPTMSHDGAYVFFMSPIALVPQALDDVRIGTDGQGDPEYAQNVYEWRAGHVYLISDGRDLSADSIPSCGGARSSACLIGTDATGANVFFTTADRLVPQDTDTEIDYYDARVGGGIPFTPPPEPCTGDDCKPPPSGTPPDQAPGSSAPNGTGNQGKNLGGTNTTTKQKCKNHKHKHRHKHQCKKSRKSRARRANTDRGAGK